MSVQAWINVFENIASKSNTTTTSASTVAVGQDVHSLVVFFETLITPVMTPTPVQPRTRTSSRSTAGIADVPSTDEPISSTFTNLASHTKCLLETTVFEKEAPPAESTSVSPLDVSTEGEEPEEMTPATPEVAQAAAVVKGQVHRSLPSRLRPTKILLPRIRSLTLASIQVQPTAQVHAERCSRSNLVNYRVRAGSRLFDFLSKPRYLQQAADAKQRNAIALA